MYADPNVGGMLFQAVMAALALGVILAVSRQMRSRFTRLKQPVRVTKRQQAIRRIKKD